MKNFTKKMVVALVALMAVVCMSVSLVACGAKEAVLNGAYGSGTYNFLSAYPGYTFKQVSTYTQNLNTYDDGTYVMIVTQKNLSGDLSFDPANSGDNNTSGTNDRGQSMTMYYGTYTSSEEEGMLSVVISTPTKVVKTTTGNVTGGAGYLNTSAWTDAMKTLAEGKTAEEYLASVAYSQKTIVVDLSTNGFTYVDLSVTPAA